MLLPTIIPLSIEVIFTLIFENSGAPICGGFRWTNLIAKFLNQEKCLDMPANKEDLNQYHLELARKNSNKNLKYVIIEDLLQISIQIIGGIKIGMTGFWALFSPMTGLLSIFLAVKDWNGYNWEETTWQIRLVKVILFGVQIIILVVVY